MPGPILYRCVPLALLATTSSPAGCPEKPFESYDYHATAITRLSSPSTSGPRGTSITLKVEGLSVRIASLDEARRGQPAPRLALRLLFEPREIAYSFDARQVVLRAADGSEWHPRVAGPGRLDKNSCVGGIGGERRYSFLSPKTCFDLSFDVAVEPATSWELILAGLARGQRRLDPVAFRLWRTCWDFESPDPN